MPFKVDNTEITRLYVDGVECKILYFDGVPYFGKAYTLSQGPSTGVTFAVRRTESPYQHADIGDLGDGDTVYEGDKLEIKVTADSEHCDPKLYVYFGDSNGGSPRPNIFSFTVVGNVMFFGTADPLTLYVNKDGNKYIGSGSFAVPGLTSGMDILVSAIVIFKHDVVENGKTTTTYSNYAMETLKELPLYIRDDKAHVCFIRSDNDIQFTFTPYNGASNGNGTNITPIELMITVVKRKN